MYSFSPIFVNRFGKIRSVKNYFLLSTYFLLLTRIYYNYLWLTHKKPYFVSNLYIVAKYYLGTEYYKIVILIGYYY